MVYGSRLSTENKVINSYSMIRIHIPHLIIQRTILSRVIIDLAGSHKRELINLFSFLFRSKRMLTLAGDGEKAV